MGWSTVYLILAILIGILGIWNLARQRSIFLSLTGIVWFLIVLFQLYVPKVSQYRIASGVPEVGSLALYLLVPVLLVFAFFTNQRR
jgi:hypothetical protein